MKRVSKYLLVLTFIWGCTKWDLDRLNPNDLAKVTIVDVMEGPDGYTINANLEDLGYKSLVRDHGVVFGAVQNPVLDSNLNVSIGGAQEIGTFSVELSDLDSGSIYYVRAYASNDAGIWYSLNEYIATPSPSSGPGDTTLVSGVVTLTTPNNGSETSYLSTTFEWDATGASVSYLQISSDVSFTSIVHSDSTITGESKVIQNLGQSTTYYWRVKAKFSGEWSEWSEVRLFSTNSSGTVLLAPTLATPSNGTVFTGVSVVDFDWTDVTGGSQYFIEIDESSSFSTPFYSNSTNVSSIQVTGFQGTQIYYWRVRASDGSQFSNWSSSFNFTIEQTVVPTVQTLSVGSITVSSALVSSNVTDDGGSSIIQKGVCWNSSPNPTTSNSTTSDGTSTGSYQSTLSNLQSNTTYYVRAYATNAIGTSYGSELSFTTVDDPCDGITSFIYDGITYNVVVIGDQCWMKENLKRDIGNSYSYGNNISISNIYGRLYTSVGYMSGEPSSSNIPSGVQGVCATGWHLPSLGEWDILANELGGFSVAGGALKETGTSHWSSPNTGATNSSNFTALPGGYMQMSNFWELGNQAVFATSSYWTGAGDYYQYYLEYDNTNFGWLSIAGAAVSVRCVKD